MLSRERVIAAIRHQPIDQVPVYAWVRANLEGIICEAYGSVEAFEDHYEFDYAHLFGGPSCVDWNSLKADIKPAEYMDMMLPDVNDNAAYNGLKQSIAYYQGEKGRFVYVQTPGIFEALNGVFGIENHLAYLLLFEEEMHAVYKRQMEWNLAFANNCIDLGVDMVHVSDDWGAQNGLIFSPDVWWRMIYPYHLPTCQAVKRRNTFLSLHSDGNVSQVLDGIIKLGFDVVHPYQESAGMNLADYKKNYINDFTVMGGLDVQTTIGFGKLDFLASEIRRIMKMFKDGGLLFCTTHFIQDHCTIEELKFAFDLVHEVVNER
jgi:uroporphyrinogen decarboxylase